MAWSEVVEELGQYRAVIEIDESPAEPDWDMQAAVLSLYTQHWSNDVEAKNSAAEGFEDALRVFRDRLDTHGLDVFERYLRIFHGTMSFSVRAADYRETDYTYIAFDTEELRKQWGFTPEEVAAKSPEDLERLSKIDLEAWVAWATGDVWGIRIERSTGFVKTWEDGTVEDGREWVEVADTAVWGYYGEKDAETEAKRVLREHAE